MATLQEIIAKRKELGANATNVDARKALESAQTTPVAGVPPTTTPTAPVAPTPAPQVTGVDGQKFTQAPVDTNTGLSTPQQPTAPVAPTTPVDKTPGITQTEFQKAQAESEKIKAQNEAKMQQEVQKSALAQETEQKKAESMIPKTSDAIYQSLVMGQPVTPQKTGAYNEAMFKFNQYKRYASMTPVEMVTALKTGKIGSELDSMLSQNPMYQQAKAEYSKQKQVKNVVDTVKGIYNNSNNVVAEEEDPFAKLSKNLITELGYAEGSSQLDAFTQYVESDPKIIQYTQSLSGINQQINETQTLLSNAIKDFSKMKGDMPMSSFVIATSQSGRFAELNDALENLKSLKELTQADLSMATQMADAKYKAVSQDIAQANTQRNAIISQAIQAQFALAGKKAEVELANEIVREAMNDPYRAIPQMIAQYQEMGIPFERSVQQIIQDFEGSGQDLATYLTSLQKTIQGKPEYQAMQAHQMRQHASPVAEAKSTWTKIGTNPDGSDKYGFVDTTSNTVTPFVSPTGEATGDLRYLANQFPNQAWAKNNNPAGITWNANFDKGIGTAKLLADAGISYSKGTPRPANEGGNYVTFNTIEDGLRAQQIMMSQTYGNSTVGKMLSSWVGTSEGPSYAKQVAGMAGISDLNQKVSSLSPEQLSTLQMAKIQKESPGLAKLLQAGTQGTGTTETKAFKTDAIQQYEKYLQNGDVGTDANRKAIEAEFGSVENFRKQAEAYNNSENGPRQRELDKIEKLKNQVAGFISTDNKKALDNSIGAWQWTANPKMPFSTRNEKENFLAGIQNFLDGKTLQQLIDVKADGATFGALSNEELRMLQNSASELNQLALRQNKDNPNQITGFTGTKENFERVINETVKSYEELIEKKKSIMGQPQKQQNTTSISTASPEVQSIEQEWLNRNK